MKKKILIGAGVVILILVGLLYINKSPVLGGTGAVTMTASSTKYTLTTTSQRLVATSSKRAALTVQSTYCTSPLGTVFLELTNPGAVATVATGDYAVLASTTAIFTDNDLQPSINTVHGIVDAGTCTVIVTEWRTNF